MPVQAEATELGSSPISGDGVFGTKDGFKVRGMFFAHVLYAKIIDDEAEGDGARVMLEETWYVFGLDVTVSGKVGNEFIIGNAAGLWKAVHAFLYFDTYKSLVVCKFQEVVLINDCLGNDFE